MINYRKIKYNYLSFEKMENEEKLIGKKREKVKKEGQKDEKNNNKNDDQKTNKSKKSRKKERKEKNEKKNEIAWSHIFQQEKQLKNEKFEYYYKNQLSQFFPTEEKFEELLSKLREKLPCVFRISKAHHFHEGYKKLLLDDSFIKSLLGEQSNLIKIELKNLTSFKEWLNLVYNININRMELKKMIY